MPAQTKLWARLPRSQLCRTAQPRPCCGHSSHTWPSRIRMPLGQKMRKLCERLHRRNMLFEACLEHRRADGQQGVMHMHQIHLFFADQGAHFPHGFGAVDGPQGQQQFLGQAAGIIIALIGDHAVAVGLAAWRTPRQTRRPRRRAGGSGSAPAKWYAVVPAAASAAPFPCVNRTTYKSIPRSTRYGKKIKRKKCPCAQRLRTGAAVIQLLLPARGTKFQTSPMVPSCLSGPLQPRYR